MKRFEDICRMTQSQVKNYMKEYLISCNYEVICEDGFLYAKGIEPVLLVAHMDTVHKTTCQEIVTKDNRMASPQGIGGDDRCGIFIIMKIVKSLRCSVLLCEDEEVGCVGARKFTKTEYINNLGVNYMIEFDRKGNSDAVFYSCDNEDFENFVTETTGFKTAAGSLSDISVLMPASQLCAVNLSSGYYKAHTKDEYVIYEEMLDTIEAAKALINAEVTEPFEYKEKKITKCLGHYYQPSLSESYYGGFDNPYYNDYADYSNYTTYSNKEESLVDSKSVIERVRKDTYLELEVIAIVNNDEQVLYATGATKSDCWLDLFTSYPGLSFNNIADYSFM